MTIPFSYDNKNFSRGATAVKASKTVENFYDYLSLLNIS
jgi:hypothetical protein